MRIILAMALGGVNGLLVTFGALYVTGSVVLELLIGLPIAAVTGVCIGRGAVSR